MIFSCSYFAVHQKSSTHNINVVWWSTEEMHFFLFLLHMIGICIGFTLKIRCSKELTAVCVCEEKIGTSPITREWVRKIYCVHSTYNIHTAIMLQFICTLVCMYIYRIHRYTSFEPFDMSLWCDNENFEYRVPNFLLKLNTIYRSWSLFSAHNTTSLLFAL